MAQKQIFRNEERLGFLPWGDGYRLGAARWTDLGADSLQCPPNQIEIANVGKVQIPKIPTRFPNGNIYYLPNLTQATKFKPSQEVEWKIDSINTESSIYERNQLYVKGPEGSSFHLFVHLNDEIIGEYECQIEERGRIVLDPLTVTIRPIPHGRHDYSIAGECEVICNTTNSFSENYQDDLQKVELRIGENTYKPRNSNLWKKTEKKINFGSRFILHLSKLMSADSESSEIRWRTGTHIFCAKIIFDFTKINFQSIEVTGSLTQNLIQFSDLYQDGGPNEILTALNFSLSQVTLHGWPFRLEITTPTESRITSQLNQSSVPIKRNKIQEWFNSSYDENKNFRLITLTPYIADCPITERSCSLRIDLDVSRRPYLGLQGDKALSWKEFLLRPNNEYNIIQKRYNILDPLSNFDWKEEISQQKKSVINRNNIYRNICIKPTVPPEINCEDTERSLNQSFLYKETEIEIIYKESQTLYRQIYTESKKTFDVQSLDLHILYPRQQFTLKYDDTEIGSSISVDGESFCPGSKPLPVFKSHGNKFDTIEIDFDYNRMDEVFAYRTNNKTFTAPQKPGVYYLHIPMNGGHFLMEFEVHGYINEEIE